LLLFRILGMLPTTVYLKTNSDLIYLMRNKCVLNMAAIEVEVEINATESAQAIVNKEENSVCINDYYKRIEHYAQQIR